MINCNLYTSLSVYNITQNRNAGIWVPSGVYRWGFTYYTNITANPDPEVSTILCKYYASFPAPFKGTGYWCFVNPVDVYPRNVILNSQPYRCPPIDTYFYGFRTGAAPQFYITGIEDDNQIPYARVWGSKEEFIRIAGGAL